ncbi:MAG: hypothetical protein PHT40_00020 [Patescibacteria group bacterium]|nr:hypothetical protein [Patescibacteria group bacterium]
MILEKKHQSPQEKSSSAAEIEFRAKKNLETREDRQQEAEKFIASLSQKPKFWKLTGSSADGSFKLDSDVDVTALYEKDADIPMAEILARRDPDNDLVDGFIDFHYFAEDWAVYQQKPELLEVLKKSLL